MLATSIREFALAAPLAVLIAARGRWPRHCLALGVDPSVVGVMASLVSSAVPGTVGWPPALGGLIVLGPRSRPSRRSSCRRPARPQPPDDDAQPRADHRQVALACLLVFDPNGSILGNIWTQQGLAANNVLAGFRAPLIGTGWAVSRQVVLLAAILAAVAALSLIQPSIA